MNLLKTLLFITICVTISLTSVWSLPPVSELLDKLDNLQSLTGDLSAKVNLTQQKAGQGVKVYDSIFYRRDKDDTFLMIVIGPDYEKGNGYLKVGDNMWMYRRNTRTFQHINRDESISGTDSKAGDFEKNKRSELYMGATNAAGKELISEEMLGKVPVYKFELLAKVNDVTYPKQIYWVERETSLPRKVQSYSLSGTLMQTSYFLKYTQIDGKYFMLKSMFVDEFEGVSVKDNVTNKENKTIMEISGISLQKIDDSIFTKAYLENLSK